MQFTAFDAFLSCYFILFLELNKAFDDIASKMLYISKFFLYKTMAKPNFLVIKLRRLEAKLKAYFQQKIIQSILLVK